MMREPREAQNSSQTPMAGPAVSGPSSLPSLACRVPTGRPLPHFVFPSPASPSPAPAQQQADRPSKAPVTAIGRLSARYLVRHGIGGFTRGLRTAAASGTQNLAPGFTNPSLFPTEQHRGWRDFRYALRHFRCTLGAGIEKEGKRGGKVSERIGFTGGCASKLTTVLSAPPKIIPCASFPSPSPNGKVTGFQPQCLGSYRQPGLLPLQHLARF